MGYPRLGEGAFATVSERRVGRRHALAIGVGRDVDGLLDVKDCWLWR